jgi:hypothetical protein
MSSHLAAHHGIGRFYKCLFCDHEVYKKTDLIRHIYSNHKDKPNITSSEATHEIVFADSFPFVMRDGSGGGIGDVADVAAAPLSTVTLGERMKRARADNSSSS